MNLLPRSPRGLWFEDFEPGQILVTGGRTVTEADLVNFAGLSGDNNPIHLDAEYGAKSTYGQRVAHGLLIFSMVSGLLMQTSVLDGTLAAFREIKNLKFRQPVYIGDTIRAEFDVRKSSQLKGAEAGLVEFGAKVLKQDGLITVTGRVSLLILTRPA